MGYKALRNTYATERVTGAEVRRLVVAGDMFPAGYEPTEMSDVEEVEGMGPSPSNVIGDDGAVNSENADPIAGLKGDDLDDAVDAAGIDVSEGGSNADGSKNAEEKREALRQAGWTPEQ